MSTLTTFRFWLEPDGEIPAFHRLAWEQIEVSIKDVLMGGVHPWSTTQGGTDVHPSLIYDFLIRLNAGTVKPPELDSYSNDVSAQQGYYVQNSRFERTLEFIQKNVYFVENLTYLQLLDIAKERLRNAWDHRTAKRLAQQAFPGFQELRRFLKSKDKKIKLSGYGDIDQNNLGNILSLDDFEGRENLLITHGIPSLNFRRINFLNGVTDSMGRLRLAPDIRKVTLTAVPQAADYLHLTWHVERNTEVWRFRPELGKSEAKREKARAFAEEWREDEGRLCFSTSMGRLSEMVELNIVVPSFPALNYSFDHKGPTATAEVSEGRVPTFIIGGFHDRKSNGETLKDILHEYDVSMSGNKASLLQKLAKLAAKQYLDRRPEMDRFFRTRQFVLISAIPAKPERLPLLEDAPLLRNLLLTMYAMKHLRGNAILDAAHDNNTYTEEQLAHALLQGKVVFTGAFLRVA